MFQLTNGEIRLSRTGLTIGPDLTLQRAKADFSDLCILCYTTDNGYTHYTLWCDIEPSVYICASLCFEGEKLIWIRLFPQHSTETPEKDFTDMDLEPARERAWAWYQSMFGGAGESFSWGTMRYYPGCDPLYGPPSIAITYQ